MGFGTTLYTDIYFNRETYNYLIDVERDLEETNNLINVIEKDLEGLALITEPKKFCEEGQDPLWFLQSKVKDNLEELNELYVKRYKLSLLIDAWEKCHNEKGLAIPAPSEIRDKAFLSGDFVNNIET